MNAIEKTLSMLAAVLVVVGITLLVVGENVLGASAVVLGGAFYAYATTPHDGDERSR